MIKDIKFIIFLSIFLFISFSITKNITNEYNNIIIPSNKNQELDEMIGQMIMIGFRGLYINNYSQIVKEIKTNKIGGVILFNKDIKLRSNFRNIRSKNQVINLIKTLKKYSKYPLLVAIDQEGGKINRLREISGFEKSISQKYLGLINDEKTTRLYAKKRALLLNELGFNINFSPVVDIDINKNNPIIGKIERSFSDNPATVINHSKWVLEEYLKNNIYGVIKHFPGHGSSQNDTHQGLTDVTKTWQEYELYPYKELIKTKKIDIIMTAHIYNSKLDPDYPATLSKIILTDLLRDKLKYQGIIITDDMGMKAITKYYDFEKSIELAINAGADILLFANNMTYNKNIAEDVIQVIKKLINEEKIDIERIQKSYYRIMNFKKKLNNSRIE
jgi:beta-N-acetylhexosaminidase